ncbi:minor tail protein [Mycobacterium phage ShedlockHolmes]|uniref:Minor tail protein n=1 Tax=Mycobacterium phage ShedlockHolmes TaxID=1647313 RepID=A0A0F6WF53_9CAUD|nr:minor tail protein [Mycobacterium phage ShedlockHolmes]AKF15203.1 minor tail protein [Mycobacterium phage ShedlockHolmes]
MPRAYDRRPLPIDRNPLWSIMGGGIGNLPKLDAQKLWQGWLDSFKLFTGIDLSSPAKLVESIADKISEGLDPATIIAQIKAATHLDLSSPQALAASLGSLILGGDGGGVIDPSRLPQIPLANIVQIVTSLLPGGAMTGLDSVLDEFGHWTYDNSYGEGAATVTADGAVHDLYSGDLIPVKAGDVLHITGKARWAGLVATGNPVEIGVTGYTDKAGTSSGGRAAAAWPVAPSGTLPDWQSLAGTYTVPNGVVAVRLRLTVTDGATGGTVTFTPPDANKGDNLLPLNLVQDLPSRLAALLSFSTWQQFLDAAKGSPGGAISDLINRIVHLGTDGTFDASQLVNVPNMPAVPGDIVTGLPGGSGSMLHDVEDHIDNVVNKFFGMFGSGHSKDDAAAAMGAIYNQVSATAQTVQNMVASQTGDSHSGKSFTVKFADYPDGPFPNVFDLTYSGAGSGSLQISGGKAHWNKVADGDRMVIGKYNQGATLTDYQSIQGTVANPMDNGASNWLFGRSDDALQNLVYAKGTRNSLLDFRAELGCFVAGHQIVFASNVPANPNFNLGVRIGTGKGLRNFQVVSGNDVIIDYTDAAGISQVGADKRKWGFVSSTSSGGANVPADAVVVSCADADPSGATGSGARMSRRNTSSATVQGGRVLAPMNYYDSMDLRTPDITPDVPNGKFTVSLSGWYRVEMAFQIGSNAFASAWNVAPVLYKNGAVAAIGTDAYAFFYFGVGAGARYAQTSFAIYLNPGDSVQAGYDASGVLNWMVGDGAGIGTYFGITLENRSLG